MQLAYLLTVLYFQSETSLSSVGIQKYNRVKRLPVMPHFTSDKDGMGERLNRRHEGVIFITDGEHTTLDTEFAALKGALPDDIQGEVGCKQGPQ